MTEMPCEGKSSHPTAPGPRLGFRQKVPHQRAQCQFGGPCKSSGRDDGVPASQGLPAYRTQQWWVFLLGFLGSLPALIWPRRGTNDSAKASSRAGHASEGWSVAESGLQHGSNSSAGYHSSCEEDDSPQALQRLIVNNLLADHTDRKPAGRFVALAERGVWGRSGGLGVLGRVSAPGPVAEGHDPDIERDRKHPRSKPESRRPVSRSQSPKPDKHPHTRKGDGSPSRHGSRAKPIEEVIEEPLIDTLLSYCNRKEDMHSSKL